MSNTGWKATQSGSKSALYSNFFVGVNHQFIASVKRTKIVLCLMAAFELAFPASADVLELKSGQVLSGEYTGGTAGTIRFQTPSGMQVIETSQALALTFTGGTAPVAESNPPPLSSAPGAPPPSAPVMSAPVGPLVVNAGTGILVRMVDGVSSRDPQGKRFSTTLELDLIVNGVMVAKAGSRAYGRVVRAQQAGRVAGKSVLDVRLTELTVDGSLVSLNTGPYIEAGKSSLAKTAGMAATGAAIGAIAGDAGKGAAIGATSTILRKGQTVGVAPGELLEFRLAQPLTVNLSR